MEEWLAASHMYWPGHVGIALLLYAPLTVLLRRRGRGRWVPVGLAGLIPLAVAPDVDLYVAALAHRGLTHTLWGVLVAGLAFGLAVAVGRRLWTAGLGSTAGLGGPTPGFGVRVGLLACGGHLLGDVVTPMGVVPVYPLGGHAYTLDLVAAANPTANLALFAAGTLAMLAASAWRGTPSLATDRTPVRGGAVD